MIKNISWEQYFLVIGLLLAVYYGYVLVHFKKSKADKQEAEQISAWREETADEEEQEHGEGHQITDELFIQADELIEKITASVSANTDKEILTSKLKADLQNYPALNIPAFRAGINNRIQSELEKKGAIELSEREIEDLW